MPEIFVYIFPFTWMRNTFKSIFIWFVYMRPWNFLCCSYLPGLFNSLKYFTHFYTLLMFIFQVHMIRHWITLFYAFTKYGTKSGTAEPNSVCIFVGVFLYHSGALPVSRKLLMNEAVLLVSKTVVTLFKWGIFLLYLNSLLHVCIEESLFNMLLLQSMFYWRILQCLYIYIYSCLLADADVLSPALLLLLPKQVVSFFTVLQGGFAFLEVGSVRSKNATNILIKNLLDVCKYKNL